MEKPGTREFLDSSILILVEGDSDRGFVEGLCKHLKLDCDVMIMRGNRYEKAGRIINAMKSIRQFRKIVVLKDEHRLGRHILENFKNALKSCGARVVVVRKSVESWILALYGDTSAESVDDPETKLEQIIGEKLLKTYGKYREIVENILLREPKALERGVKISESLNEFVETLIN